MRAAVRQRLENKHRRHADIADVEDARGRNGAVAALLGVAGAVVLSPFVRDLLSRDKPRKSDQIEDFSSYEQVEARKLEVRTQKHASVSIQRTCRCMHKLRVEIRKRHPHCDLSLCCIVLAQKP